MRDKWHTQQSKKTKSKLDEVKELARDLHGYAMLGTMMEIAAHEAGSEVDGARNFVFGLLHDVSHMLEDVLEGKKSAEKALDDFVKQLDKDFAEAEEGEKHDSTTNTRD